MEYIACIIMLVSLASFGSTVHSWFKIKNNHAGIDTIRDLTGIMSRSEIEQLFGKPDAEGNYSVSPREILQARTTIHKITDDPYFDILCVIMALFSVLYPALSLLVFPALLYITASWGYAVYLVFAHRNELEDE